MASPILMDLTPKQQMLYDIRTSAINYKQRKSEDWRKNYTLYRDRIETNRLTQRQSVHVPFMKQTLATVLKDIDDSPAVNFESLDNDKELEVYVNAYWEWTLQQNLMDIKDLVDKKQDLFFGRTFDQMQIVDGAIKFAIVDPEDMLVDRYVDPTDLDTARYLVHQHVFVPLSTLELNKDYDQQAIQDLKMWFATEKGLIKATQNTNSLDQKQERQSKLGVLDAFQPILGETYVELTITYLKQERDGKEAEIYVLVEADNNTMLMEKPQAEMIGPTKDDYWKTHFIYNSWADDVDMQDFWTDSKADICRPANIILDVFFSQLIENRTLRSFGMNFFNSNLEGFTPQTWAPQPFGAYGIPVPLGGNITENIQRIEIPDLSESLDEMRYVQEMSERATGATATQQGVQTDRKVTLGEVQLALGEAKSRIKGMSKLYTACWKKRAEKFLKFIEAAPNKLDAVKIYKKGRNTNEQYGREIDPKDWHSAAGYTIKIWSQEDKDQSDTQTLQKMSAAVANMPGNQALMTEYQQKLLEFSKLPPEKILEILQAEKDRLTQAAQMGQGMMQGQTQPKPGQAPASVPQAPMGVQ